jgi:plasmid stabilization system protein ParE
MYKSIILPPAKEDIRDAALWYDEKQKGLGKRFISQVREKVYFIRQNPQTGSLRYDNVRTMVLNVFPFMVHYTINEISETIIVSAVLHTSRNPEIWTER